MQSRKVSTFAEKIHQNRMNTMKLRIKATLALAVIAANMALACDREMTVTDTQEGMAQQVPTAKEWNRGVVGWNLGNQFECSAPGQDGESMLIGMPEGSIKAETAWGNPVVTKKTIKAVRDAGFNAVRIPIR